MMIIRTQDTPNGIKLQNNQLQIMYPFESNRAISSTQHHVFYGIKNKEKDYPEIFFKEKLTAEKFLNKDYQEIIELYIKEQNTIHFGNILEQDIELYKNTKYEKKLIQMGYNGFSWDFKNNLSESYVGFWIYKFTKNDQF